MEGVADAELTCRRLYYARGTGRRACPAAGAAVHEKVVRPGSGRVDGIEGLQRLAGGVAGEHGGGYGQQGGEELAAVAAPGFRRVERRRFRADGLEHGNLQLMAPAAEGDGRVGTGGHAVKAHHTARQVDGVRARVDALGLAARRAQSAAHAFVGVDVDMVERGARQAAQQRSHRADGVAQQSPAAVGKRGDNGQGDECHRPRAETERAGTDGRAPEPHDHAAERRRRVEQAHNQGDAESGGHHRHPHEGPPQRIPRP